MSEEKIKIGPLAKLAGKTTRTLRFYEERGLIEPSERTQGGYRLYSKKTLVRIQWIEQLQGMGFSIRDIQSFVKELSAIEEASSKMTHISQFYSERLKETEKEIGGAMLRENDV